VIEEVLVNLSSLPAKATDEWAQLQKNWALVDDVLKLDRAAVFGPAKDRPILFSALAWSQVLLTLDREDFGPLIGQEFYGLSILTPGMLLERERTAGRLIDSEDMTWVKAPHSGHLSLALALPRNEYPHIAHWAAQSMLRAGLRLKRRS
jgi:hypothetical protein